MAEPFLGEIRMFGGNFAPVGWAFCNGQILSIAQNTALFSLIGTTYGGDGVTTFGLPDLRGRLPIHQGPGHAIGTPGGSETVTLTSSQMPAHAHGMTGSSALIEVASPAGAVFATSEDTAFYGPAIPGKGTTMNAGVVGPTGGSQPHDNMQPYLCTSFIIATEGIFPSRS